MYPGFYDPDKPAYIMASSNKCVTYGDLETASNQIAHLFRTLGLTRGDTMRSARSAKPGRPVDPARHLPVVHLRPGEYVSA